MASVRRVSPVVLAALAALIGPTFSAAAEVVYRESTRNFDLGPNIKSANDVWRAIRRNGKTEVDATTIRVGWANWRIGVRHEFTQSGRLCSLKNVKVTVDVIINVPSWEEQYRARRKLSQFFSCVRRTVVIHEARHGEIARETGERIENAFWTWLKDVPCHRFNEHANEIFHRESERGKARQAAFDKQDYARNRYQFCQRIASGDVVAGLASTSQPNHPRKQTLRSGRKWRTAENRSINSASDAGHPPTDDDEVPAARGQTQPETKDAPPPRRTRVPNAEPLSPLDALSRELGATLPVGVMLVTALTFIVGLVVFMTIGRRSRSTPDLVAARNSLSRSPDAETAPAAWAEHALEHIAHADQNGDRQADPTVHQTRHTARTQSGTPKPTFGRRRPTPQQR